MKIESGGSDCSAWRRSEDHGGLPSEGNGSRREDSSQATQAVVTILQVLVALVAARVARGVSCEAAPEDPLLLLGAPSVAASLRVTATCRAQDHRWQRHMSSLCRTCVTTA